MPMFSVAQQLLCACISAVMRSPNTCCASGNQLVGDELLDISSVYVYERAESFQHRFMQVARPGAATPTHYYSPFTLKLL